MAVGMACAGTGLREALSLLEPMLSDNTDFVRQGALIAMALVLMQQPENRLVAFRKRLDKTIKDKHEEVGHKGGGRVMGGEGQGREGRKGGLDCLTPTYNHLVCP